MALDNSSFDYPELDQDADSIRILTIAPGRFDAPLEGTLASVTFGEKPVYVALSYTWDSSYTDNSMLPLVPDDVRSPPRAHVALALF